MPTNGPTADIAPPQITHISQVQPNAGEYRGPQEVHLEPVGTPLPERLADAHAVQRERNQRHYSGDHSFCTPECCAELTRLAAASAEEVERSNRHARGDHSRCTSRNCTATMFGGR